MHTRKAFLIYPPNYNPGDGYKVRPDVVADFTAMPFPDESFWHVVFDPPHIIRKAELGDVTKAYGCLNGDWESMLAAGFRECFRVLKPNGTLIFKWCEGMWADKCDDVIALVDALRAVYSLAGESRDVKRIVHEAIAKHGGPEVA